MRTEILNPNRVTTIGIGNKTSIYVPETLSELSNLLKKGNYFIIGGGSNTVLSDKPKPNILSLKTFRDMSLNGNMLTVQAGAKLRDVLRFQIENGLSCLEFLSGIPRATVGGIVFQNAGALGSEVKDVLMSVRYIEGKTLEVKEINDTSNFSYRRSPFSESDVIVSATFKVKPFKAIFKRISDVVRARLLKQPAFWLKTSGSTFKNTKGFPAGFLLEESGLKGFRYGGLRFSDKHANFLINDGNATFNDFKTLINHARKMVQKKFNVDLELEVKII